MKILSVLTCAIHLAFFGQIGCMCPLKCNS